MFTVIYNPKAGGRKAFKALPKVKEILEERNITYTVLETIYPPKPEHYADVPCGEDDTVCVMGGDGSVLDVINNLPGHDMTLMYVPCGTGNDFIKCVKLPKKPIAALKYQLSKPARYIDYCTANGELFMNIFGLGFDVETLRKLDMFKIKFTGLKAYLMSVKAAVKEYKPAKCFVSIDGGEFVEKEMSVLSVGNGQFFGGGMKAVPDANPFDGKLDVVETKSVERRQLMKLLPLFVLGYHVKAKLATTYRCEKVTVKGDEIFYQIDGEIRKASEINIELVHNKMKFRV